MRLFPYKYLTRGAALGILFLMFAGCAREEPAAIQGYVEGEFVYMAAPAAGIVQALEVAPGDEVTSGAMLFAMDPEKELAALAEAENRLAQGEALLEDARIGQRPSEIEAVEARLKQAEAALVLSFKIFERQKVLFRDKVISAEELDKARSDALKDQELVTEIKAQLETARLGQRQNQVAAAEANVKALRAAQAQAAWNLAQTTQTAPADAMVFDTYFKPGEFVTAGKPVVSLLPPDGIKVRAFLPETDVGAIKVGTAATVSYDGATSSASGVVTFISPKAEFTPPVIYSRDMRQKLSFMVEVSFPASTARGLHPGQPVDVEFSGLDK